MTPFDRPVSSPYKQATPPLIHRSSDTPAHKDDDKRSEKIDTHKQDSVGKAKSGNGEWKPELASQSEQVAQHENNDMSMKEMQKMGADKADEGKRPSGSESSKKA
jgi:hypothetical protein